VQGLDLVYLLRDLDDGGDAPGEGGGKRGLHVGFLLEDEGGEERDDFFGRVVCENVFEDEFGEDELVGGVDLNCWLADVVMKKDRYRPRRLPCL
jgi:hypothetical protein